MIAADTLPHAMLFTGSGAPQRKEAAVALGRAQICEAAGDGGQGTGDEDYGGVSLFGAAQPAPRALPCETCPHCRKSAQGIHPDMKLLEGGGGARSFHIDAVRAMRQDAYILPNEARRKIYVLVNAQTMTAEAQNALLKLLEEPPDYVSIILTAPNPRLLLPTVVSRAAEFSLGEAVESAEDAQREATVRQIAQTLAAALYAPKTPYALLEATAPLEGDKDLLRETFPALKRCLHGMAVKTPAAAPRALALIDGLAELELALERNANLNLLLTRLALLGVGARDAER
jgi:DNA polymerase-3 subunit delta'